MPGKTILEIPLAEQEQMLHELRAARYGYLLALHVLLLCAEGRTPSEIAEFLLCSRSSVYRVVAAYKRGARWVADAAADGATPRRKPSPQAVADRVAQACACHVWVVSGAVELSDAGTPTARATLSRSLARNHQTVVARGRLCVEAGTPCRA